MFGFNKNKNAQKKKVKDTSSKNSLKANPMIFFHEDYTSKDLSELKVGRKALSLFEIRDMDVPIPEFFAVSSTVYKDLLFRAFDEKVLALLEDNKDFNSKGLAKLIKTTSFNSNFEEELLRAYTRLSGFSDSWVSVRSSVVFPERQDITFAGVFGTELNVRGFENLAEAIKDVYISIFADKVETYADINDFSLSNLQMGIVVQKMVQAETSGVTFTVDPITKDDTKLSMEAVFGLGDVISSGEITPDLYLLSKKDLDFEEKHIAPQEWMRVLRPVSKKNKDISQVEKVKISSNWSHQQKLEDRFIKDIAKVSLIIEDNSKEPQSVEWVWESGKVWVLQTKPISESMIYKNKVWDEDELVAAEEDNKLMDLAVNIVNKGKVEEDALEDAADSIKKKRDDVDKEAKKETKKNLSLVGKDQKDVKKKEQNDKEKQAEQRNTENKDEIEFLKKELLRIENKMKKVNDLSKNIKEESIDENLEVSEDSVDTEEKELIVKGLGGSFGSVKGEVLLLSDASRDDFKKDINKDVVLVMKEYADIIQPLILKSDGIIAEDGGLTSDLAITCREINIPAVLNAKNITSMLKTGDMVEIDGSIGSVYKIGSLKSKDSVEKSLEGISKSLDNDDDDKQIKTSSLDDIQDFQKLRENVKDEVSKKADSESSENSDKVDNEVSTDKKAFSDIDNLVELKKQLKTKYEEKLDKDAGVVPDDTDMKKEDLSESMEELVKKVKLLSNEKTDTEPISSDNSEVRGEINTATKVMIQADTIIFKELKEYLPVCDGVVGLSIDKLILDSKEHPLSSVEDGRFVEYANSIAERIDDIAEPIMPKEVILSIGDAKERDFRTLSRGTKYEDKSLPPDMTGIKRYLQDIKILKRVLKIVRRVRNVFKSRNVTLAGWFPQNESLVIDFKKEIASAGLQRTDSFKLYMILSKSSELLLLEGMLEANIDGLILDTARVAEDIGVESLNNPSVVNVVRRVVNDIKDYNMNLVVLCEDSEELAELCVDEGVHGIGVKKELIYDFKKKVKAVEEELIKSK